ncbi:hypothetical protein NX059_011971 [Plenodomus lindquistii]|nr:hypothetical protein NX059_011971 [Plenodomus lindquistii]
MPPSTPTTRISALTSHLASIMSTTTADSKPPITCHVLDTTAGRPATSIPVILTLLPSKSTPASTTTPPPKFTGQTNTDGRVTTWTPISNAAFTTPPSLADVYAVKEDQRWSLTFDTESYFSAKGVETFFPEVEVKFIVRRGQKERGEHFHVPVLVGGFGYTTYRGS